MALLYGRAGRLAAQNGGFRPRRAVEPFDRSFATDDPAEGGCPDWHPSQSATVHAASKTGSIQSLNHDKKNSPTVLLKTDDTGTRTPWGNYDGNGGLADGHYCASNALSPPTSFDFSKGYWAGLTWADSSPAKGKFDFSALDATLKAADAADQFVEINALVGQCAPKWLYSNGVEPLNVNWKPPTSCIPPICVPAGTYHCSDNGGQGCGCDGVHPCNQTFPDYLSPTYQNHQREWVQAIHDHLTALPQNLFDRVISVQVNAGSTGDGCPWHGRLYPAQRLAGYDKIENKTVYENFSLEVHKMWIQIFETNPDEEDRAIPLLFNGLACKRGKCIPGEFTYELQKTLKTAVAAGRLPRGYMTKAGLVSHSFSMSGEMSTYNSTGMLLRKPLLPGVYVRSRGETTLSASGQFQSNEAWTVYALMGWQLAFGMDTWQNNTLIEEQPRLRPALSVFAEYAGWRPETAADSPGAIAILRDGLDTSDTQRFPESQFGPVAEGHNYTRCQRVLDSLQTATRFPPRNDNPDNSRGLPAVGCGCGRKVPKPGFNDACYEVWPGNYGALLSQIEPWAASQQ